MKKKINEMIEDFKKASAYAHEVHEYYYYFAAEIYEAIKNVMKPANESDEPEVAFAMS